VGDPLLRLGKQKETSTAQLLVVKGCKEKKTRNLERIPNKGKGGKGTKHATSVWGGQTICRYEVGNYWQAREERGPATDSGRTKTNKKEPRVFVRKNWCRSHCFRNVAKHELSGTPPETWKHRPPRVS